MKKHKFVVLEEENMKVCRECKWYGKIGEGYGVCERTYDEIVEAEGSCSSFESV